MNDDVRVLLWGIVVLAMTVVMCVIVVGIVTVIVMRYCCYCDHVM